MIDPTANTLAYRILKRVPDTQFGLRFMNMASSLARFLPSPSDLTIEKVRIPRRHGAGAVWLVIIKPKKMGDNLPLVLHIHGGGYAVGVPEQNYAIARQYISTRPSIFVMPDYRLSLMAPFPAALDDCHDALLWMRDNAKALGGRRDQIFVMGESAGGGLTASLCQSVQETGEVQIACQFPLYAMLDDRSENWTRIAPALPTWSQDKNRIGWQLYLGAATKCPPKHSVPARAKSLANLPPAIGFIGDQDVFLDQNISYFERLKSEGVETSFATFDGGYHGVEILAANSDVGKAMWTHITGEFKRATETYFAPN